MLPKLRPGRELVFKPQYVHPGHEMSKMWNASRFCVSSLRRGHANLLCIVPILVYVFRLEYIFQYQSDHIYTPSYGIYFR